MAAAERLVLEVKGVLSVEEARKSNGQRATLPYLASPKLLPICCKSAFPQVVTLTAAVRGLFSSGSSRLYCLFVLFCCPGFLSDVSIIAVFGGGSK